LTDRLRRKIRAARDPLHWKKGRLLYKRCSARLDDLAAVRDLLEIVQSQLQAK